MAQVVTEQADPGWPDMELAPPWAPAAPSGEGERARVRPRRHLREQLAALLFGADICLAWAATTGARSLLYGSLLKHEIFAVYLPLIFTGVLVAFSLRTGLYNVATLHRSRRLWPRIVEAALGTVCAVLFLQVCYWGEVAGAPVLLAAGAASGLCFWGLRYLLRELVPQDVFVSRTIVVGTDEQAQHLLDALAAERCAQHEVVGVVVEDPEAAEVFRGHPVYVLEELEAVARRTDADLVVVCSTNGRTTDVHRALARCAQQGVRVRRMAEAYEEAFRRVPVQFASEGWVVYGFDYYVSPWEDAMFRALDIVGALLGLAVTAALLPIVALAIKLTSRGPVFYRSPDPRFLRVGQGGRLFPIVKFRTMAHGGPTRIQTDKDDSRITFVGKLLRRTKVDELPQFWNVLRGDMSLFGPRPLSAAEDDEMMQLVPLHELRRVVRPGLTGFGQVSYGTARTPEEHARRLEYDLYHVKHRSVDLHLSILFNTLRVCLLGAPEE